MIIDEILDYKDKFKNSIDLDYIYKEAKLFNIEYIARAIENGNNENIQTALCDYIDQNDYNSELKKFIKTITFRKQNTKRQYYWVADDNYHQHGSLIEFVMLNNIEYNYICNTRIYNNHRGYITDDYRCALAYIND